MKPLKTRVLGTLKQLGVFDRVAASKWRRERLLILCYHGVSLEDEHEFDPALFLSVDQFARRLQILADGKYNVLPLDDALHRLYAHELPPKSVALTFDDGTYDFLARVFPLLSKHNFPATVYLTTYYCERPYPVFNGACRYILWKQRGIAVPRDSRFALDLDLTTSETREQTLRAILEFSAHRGLSGAEKNTFLEQIADRLGFNYREFVATRKLQLLTPAEAARLSAAGIDFQLHTHRHRTPRDGTLFRAEIDDNRASIQAMTGSSSTHFCYPSGVVEPAFLPWLEEAGVTYATTCQHGLVDVSADRLLLPRFIDVSGTSEIEFEGWLTGVRAFFPSRH